MQTKRPINLKLLSFQYPPMAIVSILHRISGIILFLFMPFMIYVFYESLNSKESFEAFKIAIMSCFIIKFMIWAFASALSYHALAGLRHLWMDFGFGESLGVARKTAVLILVLAAFSILFLGIFIYG